MGMSTKGKIRPLPENLVNKIAAGECIERPANVVKELIENSIDAGADRIEVYLEDGGKRLVKVVDNGFGIIPEDLSLAILPHTTSKIYGEDDLYNVRTMGFRGEALASIASVSFIRLASVAEGYSEGAVLEAEEGRIKAIKPYMGKKGTSIEVHNLFYNTPARKKFLKSTMVEFSHCQQMFMRMALPYYNISFVLFHNGRKIADFAGVENYRDRIADVFGSDLADELIQIFVQTERIVLTGYISPPHFSKSSSKWQHIFINKRAVRDKFISNAIRLAYRGVLGQDRFPVVFLFYDIDPAFVDVNVHPTKSEVRFLDSGYVYSLSFNSIRERLRDLQDTFAIGIVDHKRAEGASKKLTEEASEEKASGEDRGDRNVEDIGQDIPYVRQGREKEKKRDEGPSIDLDKLLKLRPSGYRSSIRFIDRREGIGDKSRNDEDDYFSTSRKYSVDDKVSFTETGSSVVSDSLTLPLQDKKSSHEEAEDTRSLPKVMQVHNTYIVAEVDDGIVIIDQHALHERIIYHQLKERLAREGTVGRQRLLIPQIVELPTSEDIEMLEQLKDILFMAGFDIELFGPMSIAIHTVPASFPSIDAAGVIEDLLERCGSESLSISDADRDIIFERLLRSIACKAAVKAGDLLRLEEIQAILEAQKRTEFSSTCPHGRPTTIKLSIAELERHFKRT